MPNSRISTDNEFTIDELDLLGAWVTNGNSLIGGGGNLLGSTDNFGFFFLTNNVIRGGYKNTGERFLRNDSSETYSEYKETTRKLITNDNLEECIFKFFIPTNTIHKFTVNINFLSEDLETWGNFERKITILKTPTEIKMSRPTYIYSESTNHDIKVYYKVVGDELRFYVNGLPSKKVTWTSYINYFGAYK